MNNIKLVEWMEAKRREAWRQADRLKLLKLGLRLPEKPDKAKFESLFKVA